VHRRSHRLTVQHKVWLETPGGFALGDGGISLLRAIDTTGSLRAAVQHVGWSYRHGLAYVDNAERALGWRIVERARGGSERGGARLTAEGRTLVRHYTMFRTRLDRALQRLARTAFPHPAP
jgi:molybdate transport system regulatory protein